MSMSKIFTFESPLIIFEGHWDVNKISTPLKDEFPFIHESQSSVTSFSE